MALALFVPFIPFPDNADLFPQCFLPYERQISGLSTGVTYFVVCKLMFLILTRFNFVA